MTDGKATLSPVCESMQSPISESSRFTQRRIAPPWRHLMPRHGPSPTSRTLREFRPGRQRRRLFATSILQWCITLLLCGLLAACLAGFGTLLRMRVGQIKAFNALIVLISVFLGQNLTSSFREYALMLRWRLLASRYRPLDEFDLLMHCDSLRKVMTLFWVARTPGRVWLNKMQWLCTAWLSVNVTLQVLVALLGLTYSLNTSGIPERRFGQISIADLSVIRDVWGAEHPTYDAQLGSANSYGIQGQDYLFVNSSPPGQGRVPSYGMPSTPTIYANDDWTSMRYVFQDLNVDHSDITLLSHRSISTTATCASFTIVEGGNGNNTVVTYLDEDGQRVSLDVVRVGPGAMTYIGVLNSTCGPRCTEVMALQSADGTTVPSPSFYKCQNTLSSVLDIDEYLQAGQNATLYQMPDTQARIIAGAIGWSGFNYTPGDQYQYMRYTIDSWWSPDMPADIGMVASRVMEFSIEAVAAMDYNGPRRNVTGWYPVQAQLVSVQWRWAGTILGVIPLIHLLTLFGVITWANQVIIRDPSCLSTARLLRPVVEKLGSKGCLLTGSEIADELAKVKVKYGWREPAPEFTFMNKIDDVVRHVDILEENEGLGIQGMMPPGRYDGLDSDAEEEGRKLLEKDDDVRWRVRQRCQLRHQRPKRSLSM